MPTLPALVYKDHRKTFQPLWLLALTSVLALALCGCSNSGATAAKSDSPGGGGSGRGGGRRGAGGDVPVTVAKSTIDRKSTRLNSSHLGTSYAVFCLKKIRPVVLGACVQHGDPVRRIPGDDGEA